MNEDDVGEIESAIKAMGGDLINDDPLGMFLRLHLRFEIALTKRVATRLVNPEAFGRKHRPPSFSLLCRIAYGIGAIDEKGYEFAKALNQIRNDFAHDVNRRVSLADVTNLAKFSQVDVRPLTDLLVNPPEFLTGKQRAKLVELGIMASLRLTLLGQGALMVLFTENDISHFADVLIDLVTKHRAGLDDLIEGYRRSL